MISTRPCAGPFEWDVKRYLASLVVLARDNGLPDRAARAAVQAALRAYRARIASYATADELTIWYDVVTSDQLLDLFEPEERERVSARLAKRARRRTSAGAARKLTRVVDGHLRIVDDPPIRVRLPATVGGVDATELAPRRCRPITTACPTSAATCSTGSPSSTWCARSSGSAAWACRCTWCCWRGAPGADPLFLQIKQAGPSVYEQFLGASPHPSHGQRVISGKRVIQAASDIFLGWTSVQGFDFYVRQFRDMKVIPDSARIAPRLGPFAEQCAYVLARAHARTGDAMAIASYVGKGRRFDEAMAAFAVAYADQTARDRRQLVAAIESGEVATQPG